MTKNTRRVLAGWLKLTPSERTEFIKELNDYQKLSPEDKRKFERLIQAEEEKAVKMAIGPLSEVCICCGR